MNILQTISNRIVTLFKKYNVAEVMGSQTALSQEMLDKIDLWNNIFCGSADWNATAKTCGIVNTTIGELANPVGEEMDVASPNNEELDVVMKRLNESSHELVQNIVALGGSVVRPIYSDNKMQFEIVKLGNYIPTSYALDGTLTGTTITKKIQDGKKEYLLLEKHSYKNKNHTVEMELYRIISDKLQKVALTDCSQTAELTPVYTWENVEKPFIVEIKNRMPNMVDGSSVPCALWQNTENLIQDADEEYNRFVWEMESGETRVFADADLFKKRQGEEGVGLTKKLNKLLVRTNGNGMDAERITTYSPALRTASHKEAFNEILHRCELSWNIGKGTLSDLATVQQTATQYTGGKKSLYSMVDSIESELEEKYKHLAYIFAYMLSAFENVAFNDELEITFNDASRKDPVQMKQIAMQELNARVLQPYEYRMQFYGEDEETAKANVPEQIVNNNFGGFGFE